MNDLREIMIHELDLFNKPNILIPQMKILDIKPDEDIFLQLQCLTDEQLFNLYKFSSIAIKEIYRGKVSAVECLIRQLKHNHINQVQFVDLIKIDIPIEDLKVRNVLK